MLIVFRQRHRSSYIVPWLATLFWIAFVSCWVPSWPALDREITVEIAYEEPPNNILGTVIAVHPASAASGFELRVADGFAGGSAFTLPWSGLGAARIAVAALDGGRCIRYSGAQVSLPGSSRLRVLLRKLPWPVCN